MLGLVFTEFIEMVEGRFSPELADAILEDVGAPHGGAYTAVGNYPHQEMLALVAALSRRTGEPEPALVQALGRHLMQHFRRAHADLLVRHGSLFDLVAAIDGEIHVEVRKLYEQAAPPRFTVTGRDPQRLSLLYESPRCLQHLALGLLEAAAEHYGERVRITRQPHEHEGRRGVLFQLERLAA